MQQDDPAFGPQPAQRRLQLQGLVQRLPHEQLDDVLSPRSEGSPAEAAREALHPGKAHSLNLDRVAVEHLHPGLTQDLADLRDLPGLVVVIPEDGDDWNADRGERARQLPCLVRLAPIGQVAAQCEDVRRLGHLREQRLKGRSVAGAPEMDVGQRRHPDHTRSFRHRAPTEPSPVTSER